MPTLPISPVTLPAILRGQTNGMLPAHLLQPVVMPGGGPPAMLVESAARCFRALVAAAARDGILLMSTEGYRDGAKQERLFRDRFRTYDTGRRPAITRKWHGQTWWLLPGVALAAVPLTSNHGWGLAADLAEQLDGDPQSESISDRAVRWLIANASRFGISAELQSEDWHWRAVAGDNLPPAVLAYESTSEDDMPVFIHDESNDAVYEYAGIEPATGKGRLVGLQSTAVPDLLVNAGAAKLVDIGSAHPDYWTVVKEAPSVQCKPGPLVIELAGVGKPAE